MYFCSEQIFVINLEKSNFKMSCPLLVKTAVVKQPYSTSVHSPLIMCKVSRLLVDLFNSNIRINCLNSLQNQSCILRSFKIPVGNFNGKIKHSHDCNHKLEVQCSTFLCVSDLHMKMNGVHLCKIHMGFAQ